MPGTPPHWQLGCVSGTPGTHSEVPTHCNQHMPLKGVLQLPLNGHLEAQGRSGACQRHGSHQPACPGAAREPPGYSLSAHRHRPGSQHLQAADMAPPAGESG